MKKNNWTKIEYELPNFNGRVIVKYLFKNQLIEKDAWYETGDRRFKKGFSLIPKNVEVLEWKLKL